MITFQEGEKAMAVFTMDGLYMLLRWAHFLAGITWIGLLYYFNFVQSEWFKEAEADVKSAAVQKLVPRALWWFRWAAMVTFLAGALTLLLKGLQAGWAVYDSSWGIFILLGSALGTLMFLNVWFIIWPAQKVVITSANQVAEGREALPDALDRGAKATLASRTNTLFSVPMLFFMGAASHLPLNYADDYNRWTLWIVLAIIVGAIEINGIVGKPSVMTTVKGVITWGFVLSVVLYAVIEIIS